MNFIELQKLGNRLYNPIFALGSISSHKSRQTLEAIFGFIFVLFAIFSILLITYQKFLHSNYFVALMPKTFGLTSILFVVWIILFVLESFYYSYYYLEPTKDSVFIDFDLAKAINKTSKEDILSGLFKSNLGSTILMRCGVSFNAFEVFLSSRKVVLNSDNLEFSILDNQLTLKDFSLTLLEKDKELTDFFFSFGVQKKELAAITEWIMELNDVKKSTNRWWSHENLSHIPGIGQNWSYGQIYNLEKYERPLFSGLSKHYRIHSSYGVKEREELEAVLSRTREANAVLVGNDEAGSLDIISHLARTISEGTIGAGLKHKRVVLLDNEKLISSNGSKALFESEFITIMQEAIYAGNIVLVIPGLPSFISSVQGLGVDFATLIDPYLSSQNLQIIALSDTEQFHNIIEKNGILSQNFEIILVKEINDSNTIKVLENEIVRFEHMGLFFTYGAVSEIAVGAERYFPGGAMPDKAIDLLLEIVPKLLKQGKTTVEKTDILSLIETKTGIPVGEVGKVEKEKLLNLEEILHKRIVGQNEAIVAISNAVRRARSGITNPDRPMGSFLFLGPTGVGKTETTKALADVFFGEKANILRLDMSEYSSFDATSKLIGSFEGNKSGVLSSMLREHPYGVLLLDEFEKTTKEVMNLFLQILDEGFFSDMKGSRINARNLIIIATSNAGSDLIWEAMKSGKDMSKVKDSIIDSIVKDGTFKPELLNRFDGVILFHPLQDVHLRKIAEMMLQKLHERLALQGINLTIDENLINFVTNFGTDPKFGARPMNRAIQEKVEEIVAKKIIVGSIPKGSSVTLGLVELV